MKKIMIAAAIATLAGCATPSEQDIANADYGSYPNGYEQIIKDYMSDRLKDPESARYVFLNSPKSGWIGIGGLKFGHVVCANINAKNSYGGYTGARMSFFMIKNGRVIDASHGDGNYGDAIVSGKCRNFL